MEYIYESDILTTKAQIIAQQCNCVTKVGKGLSADIAQAFPHADFYSKRTTPSTPGTIEVRGGKGKQWICALFAQYHPGAPNGTDTKGQRVVWFMECLAKISKIKNLRHIAFPSHIGCGLAKGDWEVYHQMLIDFSSTNPNVRVTIVSKDPKEEPVDYSTMSLVDYTKKYVPSGWEEFFKAELDPDMGCLTEISTYLEKESERIFPPLDLIYTAFRLTTPKEIRVLILGQDPYHSEDQAMGIAFGVGKDIPSPPSLCNIYKELLNEGYVVSDLNNGDLTKWCAQGVFLINTSLTVRAHTPKSHSKKWMEGFTPSLLRWIDRECDPLVVILWGNDAQSMAKYFGDRHRKIFSVHPSPLSASRGFFGSKPFSKANKYLKELKREAIDWSL